jgi:type I restriction enzyme, S subunit
MNQYPSYKESGVEWIGEIPSGWNVKRINHFFVERKETVDDQSYLPLSVTMEGILDQLEGVAKTDNNDNRKKVCKGDFVINSRSDRKGSSGVSFRDGSVSVINTVLEPISIHPQYVNHLFKSYYFKEEFFRNGKGIHFDLWSTKYTTMKNIEIPDLSFKEQQQISNYLDHKTQHIDSLIEKTQQKIELLEEQRTSLINQVVTKGLNPDVEMKDSGVEWIGEIPSGWILIKLHTLISTDKIEFQDGNHGGEHPNPEEFEESGVPFIKPKDIQNGKINWEQCDRLPFDRCERFRIGFSNNDDVLLVNRGGSIGKVCYVSDFDDNFSYFVINPQVTYIRGKNGLLSKFLYYISISNIFQCGIDLVLGHGSTFPFLGLSNMGDFEIVFPVTIEQQQIVEYLDKETTKIDSTIEKETQRINLLKEYRQSLISNVVTGKVDVRDEVVV